MYNFFPEGPGGVLVPRLPVPMVAPRGVRNHSDLEAPAIIRKPLVEVQVLGRIAESLCDVPPNEDDVPTAQQGLHRGCGNPRVPGGPLVVPLPATREGVEQVGAVEGLEVVLGR